MISKSLQTKNLILPVLLISLLLSGCGGDEKPKTEEETEIKTEIDPSNSTLLTVNGELFSIPSPIQTAILIKQIGSNYNKEMLNPPKNISSYSTRFQKALNLGVYGANLGYVTIYDQTQDAMSYLQAVRKIADELGVTGAFDNSLIDRFEKNMGNKDSILVLVSNAYRASDSYLKNNDKDDVAVLILAGGWIESTYFATEVAKQTKNKEVINRIGEQKNSLENLIKLLSPFYKEKGEFTSLIDNLVELVREYDGIKYTYVYEKPTVDAANKTTIINSRTNITISDQQLEAISNKIQLIRNQIVG